MNRLELLTLRVLSSLLFFSLTLAAAAQGTGPSATGNAGTPPINNEYLIGPGDTLEVFVWRNPELSTRVPVRPDGKISTPLVEDMVAVGKTTSALARDVEAVLSRYVRSPQVNVLVITAVSAMSSVTVVGAAARPGTLPYREGLRVMDAILAVGGMTQFAAGNRAKIVRQSNGKSTEVKVKLKSLLEKGDLSQNFPLRPGDVLVIPESFF